jgi:polyisoprenoid-binding protein YceI
MKNSVKSMVAVAVVALFAFSFTAIVKEKKAIKIEASTVVWRGYKVTGSHEGNLKLESGNLIFDNGVLTGGEFTMNMTSLTVTDLSGDGKAKLEGHLKSEDFFGVEKHAKSNLVFKTVKAAGKNAYKVTGDLTIKNKTNPVTFDFSVYGSKANAFLKVDRTKFDVRYGSSSFFDDLKDKAIYDEFDLVVDLQF